MKAVVLITAFMTLSQLSIQADEPAKLAKALVDTVESRRLMKTVQMTSETIASDGTQAPATIKRRVWIDIASKLYRCDVSKDKFDGKEIDIANTVLCFECIRPTYLTRYSTNKDGSHTSVLFDKLTEKNVDRILHRIDWQDFGLFGRAAKDCRTEFTNEFINILKSRIAAAGNTFTWSGGTSPSFTFSYLAPNQKLFKYELQFSDPSLTRCTRYFWSVGDYSEEARLSYPPERRSDVHFPSRMEFTATDAGKVVRRETTKVSNLAIDETIDRDIFQLQSFKIADGTPIQYPEISDANKHPVWRGSAVQPDFNRRDQAIKISAQESAVPIPDVPKPSFIGRSWPFLIGAAVLAGLGIFLIRKRRES